MSTETMHWADESHVWRCKECGAVYLEELCSCPNCFDIMCARHMRENDALERKAEREREEQRRRNRPINRVRRWLVRGKEEKSK